MSQEVEYSTIVRHYEVCLERHGDSHLGVDWPNVKDAETRYQVMLEMIPAESNDISVLDFGCGLSHLYEFIQRKSLNGIMYSGLDMSPRFIQVCRRKYPGVTYYCADVLRKDASVPMFDYIIANGVFTEKCGLSQDQMLNYFYRLLSRIFSKARKGIAFNVMSTYVDWEREDLFYLAPQTVVDFVVRQLSRHFVIRNDYGLYEFTAYVYKEAFGCE